MTKFSWRQLLVVAIFTVTWLKLFDLISYQITNKWAAFFSYYDGYRLPAGLDVFLPFTIDTINRDKHPIIIFPGDSTSGGFLYHHSQAIPTYLNDILNKRNQPVHTYNLALSGAHLSEQYLIIKSTIDKADTVVFPIHYSFFSGNTTQGKFTLHPQLQNYLWGLNPTDVSPLNLSLPSQISKVMSTTLGSVWYTYKVHRLLPYIALGQPTQAWLKSQLFSRFGTPAKPLAIPIDPSRPFSQQTAPVQTLILEQNRLLWERLGPITADNPNLIYLQKIGQLKQTSGKKFIAYFVPLDLKVLKDNRILDESQFTQIITTAKQTLDRYGIKYIDFNLGNPAHLSPADFYNPDHLLPPGNLKVAQVLADKISHDF